MKILKQASIILIILVLLTVLVQVDSFNYFGRGNKSLKPSSNKNLIQIPDDINRASLNAPSYNITQSKEFIILGVASYCDKKCLQSWSCGLFKQHLPDSVQEITYIMGTLTRASGYVAYDKTKNMIVTSWRGSQNIQNWIEDFTFDLVDYAKCKNCKVHLGFMEDYLSLQKKMTEAIVPLLEKYPTAKILSTGWSLGAAISVIAGIQLKLKYNRDVQIHNNGCPRVGNPSFAQFVNSKIQRIFRLVHHKDIVPHLPPQSFGFHHVAYEVFFDKEMQNYTVCNQNGQDSACSNKYFPDYSAADHDFYFWDLDKLPC